jgi:hypothetical protein
LGDRELFPPNKYRTSTPLNPLADSFKSVMTHFQQFR